MIDALVFGAVVATSVFLGVRLGGAVLRRFKQWRIRRWEGRIVEALRACDGKYLRHRPTGEVGICVAAGVSNRWRLMVEVVTCKGCAARVAEMGMPALFFARMNGCVKMLPHAEVVAALGSEIAEFKSSAEEGAQEA